MALIIVGSVPENITYSFINKTQYNLSSSWDKKNELIDAYTVFASDSNKFKKENAESFFFSMLYNRQDVSDMQNISIENKPIKNLKIINYNKNLNQSMAEDFFVMHGEYVFPIENSSLLEIMLNSSIKNGIIEDELIWVYTSGRAKLIRVDSEDYKSILEYSKRRQSSFISKKDFEVGGVYSTRSKKQALYLGPVNTISYEKPIINAYSSENLFKYKESNISNALFFFILNKNEDVLSQLRELEKEEDNKYIRDNLHAFSIQHTFACIEQVAKIDLDKDYISILRTASRNNLKARFLNDKDYYESHIVQNQNNAWFIQHKKQYEKQHIINLDWNTARYSKLLNMCSTKEQPEKYSPESYTLFH